MNKKNLELGKKPSAIRELFEYAKKKKQEVGEDNVFDYSIGNPSAPTADFVTEILINLLKSENTTLIHGYTSAIGDYKVREAVAKYINAIYNASISEKYIYMVTGAAAGITITFNALLNEGDEVLTFSPHFPEYPSFLSSGKGKFVTIPSKGDMQMDLDLLNKSINKNTKIFIINSPNNPTGAFYDEESVIALANILKAKEKEFGHPIYLLSDEPYRELLYENEKYPFVTNYYDDAIVCYSFSKSLSLPGERIGYLIVNPKCNDADDVIYALLGAGRSLGYVSAPSLFQHLLVEVYKDIPRLNKHYEYIRDFYKTNRDLLYKSLVEIGYEVIYPKGAFYMFMKALEEDAIHFKEVAKEYNLCLVPSDSFGYQGYVRLSYVIPKKQIEKSIEAFKKLYERYQR